MGSGAFLVAACRYLADRLVEAWQAEGRADALAAQQHQQAHRIGADAEAELVLLTPGAGSPSTACTASTSTRSPSRWRSCRCG